MVNKYSLRAVKLAVILMLLPILTLQLSPQEVPQQDEFNIEREESLSEASMTDEADAQLAADNEAIKSAIEQILIEAKEREEKALKKLVIMEEEHTQHIAEINEELAILYRTDPTKDMSRFRAYQKLVNLIRRFFGTSPIKQSLSKNEPKT